MDELLVSQPFSPNAVDNKTSESTMQKKGGIRVWGPQFF